MENKDRQRIISFFIDHESLAGKGVDVTERLYSIVQKDEIEGIKYMMPSATEKGVYYSIVVVEKKEKKAGVMGFQG